MTINHKLLLTAETYSWKNLTTVSCGKALNSFGKFKVNRERPKFVMERPELKILTLAKWLISSIVCVIITLLFIIPRTVLLSSIQPEAETRDFSTHALLRNL